MGEKSRKKRENREAKAAGQVPGAMPFPGPNGEKQDIKTIPVENIDKNELNKFVILCKDPETKEDIRIPVARSIVALAKDLKTTLEKYGPDFANQDVKVITHLPADKDGANVVTMPIAEGKGDEIIKQVEEKIAPPQAIEATLQRQCGMFFEVSGLKAISYVYVCEGAGIGGAVIVNPNNAITNGEGTQLFKAIQAQADEFKRNAEAKGFRIDDSNIIIPNAGQINKFK